MRETALSHLNTFVDLAAIFAGVFGCNWMLGTPLSETSFWAVVAFTALLRTHRLEQTRKGTKP